MLYILEKMTSLCFFNALFSIKTEGHEAIPEKGPFLLAPNHPSFYDPPLLGTFINRKLFFLGKEEMFNNPLACAFFRHLGGIPLKRNTGDAAGMREALRVLQEKPLVMFPQGKVGASMDTVNPGVGFLARKSGVPVIAARIRGAECIPPLIKNMFKRKKIRISFAPVGVQPDDTNETIARRIMETIKNL